MPSYIDCYKFLFLGSIKNKMHKDNFYFFSIKKGQNFKKVLGLGLVLLLVSKALCVYHGAVQVYSWLGGSVVERRSLIGELSLVCTGPAADG